MCISCQRCERCRYTCTHDLTFHFLDRARQTSSSFLSPPLSHNTPILVAVSLVTCSSTAPLILKPHCMYTLNVCCTTLARASSLMSPSATSRSCWVRGCLAGSRRGNNHKVPGSSGRQRWRGRPAAATAHYLVGGGRSHQHDLPEGARYTVRSVITKNTRICYMAFVMLCCATKALMCFPSKHCCCCFILQNGRPICPQPRGATTCWCWCWCAPKTGLQAWSSGWHIGRPHQPTHLRPPPFTDYVFSPSATVPAGLTGGQVYPRLRHNQVLRGEVLAMGRRLAAHPGVQSAIIDDLVVRSSRLVVLSQC